jgi:hypothetical protein
MSNVTAFCESCENFLLQTSNVTGNFLGGGGGDFHRRKSVAAGKKKKRRRIHSTVLLRRVYYSRKRNQSILRGDFKVMSTAARSE